MSMETLTIPDFFDYIDEERDFQSPQYEQTQKKANLFFETVLSTMKSILKSPEDYTSQKEFILSVGQFMIQTDRESFPLPSFTNITLSQYSKEILTNFAKQKGYSSLADMITQECETLFGLLSTQFHFEDSGKRKDTSMWWRKRVELKWTLQWLILHSKELPLGVYQLCFPLCFSLFEDHETRSKIIAVNVIQHISKTISKAELNNYAELIIQKLLVGLVFREKELVSQITRTIDLICSKTNVEIVIYDQVVRKYLYEMKQSTYDDFQFAFLHSLSALIPNLQMEFVKFFKLFLPIMYSKHFLLSEKKIVQEESLKTMRVCVVHTWPRFLRNEKLLTELQDVLLHVESSSLKEELETLLKDLI